MVRLDSSEYLRITRALRFRWCVSRTRHTLRLFAVHDTFIDLLEAEFRVHRQRRSVLLHRLGFDKLDAAAAEPVKRLAEQKSCQPFAPLLGCDVQIEPA